jgi:hypothetical protein
MQLIISQAVFLQVIQNICLGQQPLTSHSEKVLNVREIGHKL